MSNGDCLGTNATAALSFLLFGEREDFVDSLVVRIAWPVTFVTAERSMASSGIFRVTSAIVVSCTVELVGRVWVGFMRKER